ncbi:Protein of unknown function [Shimia gijangensis]|uniref:Nucleoside-triphosphatase THEP1 n=1 Tax=Shimia gijangensis TaxID=1470563 RepID=A0A1M6BL21_9RHOB|nr:DUF2478 domain-containing protein [Shimia gijangensis]SHI49411.1 Protein of unknown function [Shimia gijangensis]
MTKIAYTMTEGKGALDRLLADFADTLAAKGVRTCGIVQINSECGDDEDDRCDMDVRVLPNGSLIRISQSLGRGSQGCRLDGDALEAAVAEVGRLMETDFDIFILNKYGKQEAEGRGFRDLIAHALERGAAVIAGTNGLNSARFDEFSGGLAEYVPPEPDALMQWFQPS